jgi:hypothetical protein
MVDSVFIEGSGCECDVTLDTWLRDSLSYLPGSIRSVAARELVLAAREFFERSYAWQGLIEDQDAKAGRKQYWLSPWDEYANVVGVIGVTLKGNPISPVPVRPARVNTTSTGTAAATSDRPGWYYAAPAPDAIELFPDLKTDIPDGLTFHVALTPKTTVEHLPRVAEIKYYDAILDGFLARMYMHPSKPYTSIPMAQFKRKSFNHWIGKYMGQAKQGYVGAQNWSFPSEWGVRRLGQAARGG